jgi:hypothetical protein
LIYDQATQTLSDAEDIAVHRTDPVAEFDTWEEALHKDPALPSMAARLQSECII